MVLAEHLKEEEDSIDGHAPALGEGKGEASAGTTTGEAETKAGDDRETASFPAAEEKQRLISDLGQQMAVLKVELSQLRNEVIGIPLCDLIFA